MLRRRCCCVNEGLRGTRGKSVEGSGGSVVCRVVIRCGIRISDDGGLGMIGRCLVRDEVRWKCPAWLGEAVILSLIR